MRGIRLVILAFSILSFNGLFAGSIEKPTWEKMAEDYEYDPPEKYKSKPKKPAQKDEPLELPKSSPGIPASAAYLLYALLGVGFIALLIAIVRGTGPRNKKVKLRNTYDEENPDELVLTELERELQDASRLGNYNRCLRYHFLLLLERLERNGVIIWHKFKTNGEYLDEAIGIPQHKRLRQLTVIYEYYWYGEHVLTESEYLKNEKYFVQLRKELGDE